MSILELDFDGVDDVAIHPEGTETVLRITNVQVKPTNAGDKTGMTVFFEDAEDGNIDDVVWWSEIYSAERKAEDPKGFRRTGRIQQAFLAAFDISIANGLDTEMMKGAEGSVILGVTNDEEYGDSNNIKRFQVGH